MRRSEALGFEWNRTLGLIAKSLRAAAVVSPYLVLGVWVIRIGHIIIRDKPLPGSPRWPRKKEELGMPISE
jgi:hypothetical protein